MRNLALVAGGGLLLAFTCGSVQAQLLYATNGSNLVSFTAVNPGTLVTNAPIISGLQIGETIVGLDFDPTNTLYAVGSTSRLYTIVSTATTATATQVGSAQFTTLLNGTSFGVDFDTSPTFPELRIVSDNEQNLRIDPANGTVLGVDPLLNPAGNVVAGAYRPSDSNLYVIDSVSGFLERATPSTGGLTVIGSLNVGTNLNPGIGFDVDPAGTPYASITVGGQYRLYQINLPTGAATLIGPIGTGTYPLLGLAAAVPEPGTAIYALAGCVIARRWRSKQ